MNLVKRPMLAPLNSPKDTPTFFEDIQYPQLVSPKIDGIRGVIGNVLEQDFASIDSDASEGSLCVRMLSRNLERFRSEQVNLSFNNTALIHFDGELAYDPVAPDCLHVTQSHVSSFSKPCDTLRYYVFDWCNPETAEVPYYKRHELLVAAVEAAAHPMIEVIPQLEVNSLEELLEIEAQYLAEGYEGVMFRNPVGIYKHNRATYRQNLIYKLKRFTDAEAIIIGFVEGENNNNEQTRDARGYAKRSDAKAGKTPNGMIGKFIVKDIETSQELYVTPGVLKHPQRKYIFEHQDEFMGKIITYRSFGYGVKNKARFSRFVAFREKWDM